MAVVKFMKDYYNILGVEPDASDDEVKKMYHKLSKKYHPDANITDPDLRTWSEARMKELNEAYDTLKDPVKRALYDRRRHNPGPRPSPGAPPRPSPVSQIERAALLRTAGINALIFAMFGLVRAGLPGALTGAAIGAMIGAALANIRLWGLPPAVTQGLLLGMFLGSLLLKPPLVGLLVGAGIGALGAWYLSKR